MPKALKLELFFKVHLFPPDAYFRDIKKSPNSVQNQIGRQKLNYCALPAKGSGEEKGERSRSEERCFLEPVWLMPLARSLHSDRPSIPPTNGALLLGDADGPSFQTEMAAGKCGTAGRELGENVLHKYMYI